jgi:methionine sulfoxide reductase heme-binding subunit
MFYQKVPTSLLKAFIHLVSLCPLLWLYHGAFNDTIGADPVEYVIHFTGIGAFNLLLVTLLISPLSKKLKWPNLAKCRRLIGLYSATYALFHLLNFIFFELQFDFTLLLNEVIDRPYITIGMVAFFIMLLLSITSISFFRKKMGKSWQTLHSFIYFMALLIGVHFYWSVKSEIIEPSIYLILVFLLIMLRRKRVKQWLSHLSPFH